MKKWAVPAILVLFLTVFFGAFRADAANAVTQVNRLSGATRYDTAAEIAKAAFPNGAAEAVLVSGAKFPDALSAAGLAGLKKCPVLLTNPKTLSAQTENLIKKFGVRSITILGGENAVSPAVASALTKSCGIPAGSIRRIAGTTRFATALQVEQNGNFDPSGACIIASGVKAADAVSISPWSYRNGWPILLADGKGNLSSEALATAKKFAAVYVIGAENAVSAATFASLPQAVRISGRNRYETSVKIAKQFAASYQNTVFASGQDAHFPDPLVGGMLAGKYGVPLLLVDGTTGAGFDFTDSSFSGVTKITVLGSEKSVPSYTVKRIQGKKFAGCTEIKTGRTATVDLNADGKKDTIALSTTYRSGTTAISVRVNGHAFSMSVKDDFSVAAAYAADLNIGDDCKNIILSGGTEGDVRYIFLAYDDSGVRKMQSFGNGEIKCEWGNLLTNWLKGDGNFSYLTSQNWGVKGKGLMVLRNTLSFNNFTFSELRTDAGVKTSWDNAYSYKPGFTFTTLARVACYTDRGCTAQAASIPKGTTVTILGFQTEADYDYNLYVSFGGRKAWIRRGSLNKKNVVGYYGVS